LAKEKQVDMARLNGREEKTALKGAFRKKLQEVINSFVLAGINIGR